MKLNYENFDNDVNLKKYIEFFKTKKLEEKRSQKFVLIKKQLRGQKFVLIKKQLTLIQRLEKIGWHKSTLSIQLSDKEAVLVHIVIHSDYLASLESKLGIRIHIGRQRLRIIVVQRHHSLAL
ncbi:hypothetical protein BpHYR1_012527 [Brachionus plicatilis]|uniref:Uncharacterized protein n=1 Tax=Brachionus plicatilis TaxID=10195 RepID=A0A3M7SD55_BRAPC|nr:hypothetical protein BpHYR1_012527 [Brachionus plicatilis]